MLIVDAANVIGSRPTGWWRDRPGAARGFVEQLRAAVREGRLDAPLIVVLEGKSRQGVAAGDEGGVEVVHASGEGDDAIVAVAAAHRGAGVVITADRGLTQRVRELDGEVRRPGWLLDRLGD